MGHGGYKIEIVNFVASSSLITMERVGVLPDTLHRISVKSC